jgi:hypothetical protein
VTNAYDVVQKLFERCSPAPSADPDLDEEEGTPEYIRRRFFLTHLPTIQVWLG